MDILKTMWSMLNSRMSSTTNDLQSQLKKAHLLGYGDKKTIKPIYEQLNKIREKTDDGKSGKGFFDRHTEESQKNASESAH